MVPDGSEHLPEVPGPDALRGLKSVQTEYACLNTETAESSSQSLGMVLKRKSKKAS